MVCVCRQKTLTVTVSNVGTTTETYNIRSVSTAPGSAADYTTPVAGYTKTNH